MDISKLILEKINKKKEVKVSDIVKETGFSRAYINRFFKKLREEKKIVLIGKANQSRYIKAARNEILRARKKILWLRKELINKNLSEDLVLKEIKEDTGIFLGLPANVSHILDYAFTEMLNNAIEHSLSKKILVFIEKDSDKIIFNVIDYGIGIFKNIMKKRNLKNELEAIQDLLKGKQTTAPEKHTGEGIFFTSKSSDRLIIKSFTKELVFDNKLNDIFVKDIKSEKGTSVRFEIFKNSENNLNEIFRAYTDEAFGFNKTKVIVKLYKIDEVHISRSQARRIMSGLDKFKTIILDFGNVETVGQSFADEIFRVWQKNYPDVKIIYQNANENIEFVIKRALAEK